MDTLTDTPTGDPVPAPRHRRKWQQTEKEEAVSLLVSGYSIEEIAVRLGREEWGVRSFFSNLGIRPGHVRIISVTDGRLFG